MRPAKRSNRKTRFLPPFFSLSLFLPTSLLLSRWAWMDLNHRPHPYQGCALTKLSYRPDHVPTRPGPPLDRAYSRPEVAVNIGDYQQGNNGPLPFSDAR